MKLIHRQQYLSQLQGVLNTPDIRSATIFPTKKLSKERFDPLLKIRDAYPKILLARTRKEETDYEGIRIVDIPRWLYDWSY